MGVEFVHKLYATFSLVLHLNEMSGHGNYV